MAKILIAGKVACQGTIMSAISRRAGSRTAAYAGLFGLHQGPRCFFFFFCFWHPILDKKYYGLDLFYSFFLNIQIF